jgi:acetyl esterase/lipase
LELLTPFTLPENDQQVAFQVLGVQVDGVKLNPIVYSPKAKPDNQKYPCIIWLHGGTMGWDGGLFLHAPNEFPTNRDAWEWVHSATFDRQTEARFFASRGVVFALITINPGNGKNDVCKQIKSQVEAIKGLNFVDPNGIAAVGHSNGGYAFSLLANKYPEFLRQNFPKGIVFASPYFEPNDSPAEYSCSFEFAAPDDQPPELTAELAKKTIEELKDTEYREYVLRYTYPFSERHGMSDEILLEKLKGAPPIHIFMAEGDDITPPADNGGMFAERLEKLNKQQKQKIKFEVHPYAPPISHCLHAKPVLEDLLKIIQQP